MWSDYAVLARTHEALIPIRAICEYLGIPVTVALNREKTPALHRIREMAIFLDALRELRGQMLPASGLTDLTGQLAGPQVQNPWWQFIRDWLATWQDETADAPMSVSHTSEAFYEALAQQRREQSTGQGVFLSTVHGAKGMEFPVVFMPDGGWHASGSNRDIEEERRLYYVGMTRARDLLCLFTRGDQPNAHARLLDGEFVVHRVGTGSESMATGTEWQTGYAPSPLPGRDWGEGDEVPAEILKRRFELLSLADLFLSFAAYRPATDPIHGHLAALQPGDSLTPRRNGNRLELIDPHGHPVAALALAASTTWLPRLDHLQAARVVGVVRRYSKDSGEEYRRLHQCESWEVPWVEMVWSQ